MLIFLPTGFILFLHRNRLVKEIRVLHHCYRNRESFSTSSSILVLALASSMTMESVTLVNLMVSGCWRYFFSSRAAAAALAFSTSRDPMGTQPIPLTEFS